MENDGMNNERIRNIIIGFCAFIIICTIIVFAREDFLKKKQFYSTTTKSTTKRTISDEERLSREARLEEEQSYNEPTHTIEIEEPTTYIKPTTPYTQPKVNITSTTRAKITTDVLVKRMKSLGWKENNKHEECRVDGDLCFTKGDKVLRFNKERPSGWIDLYTKVAYGSLPTHKSKNDIKLLCEIAGVKDISEISTKIDPLIHLIPQKIANNNSFKFEIDGLYFYVRSFSPDELDYSLSIHDRSYYPIMAPERVEASPSDNYDNPQTVMITKPLLDLFFYKNRNNYRYADFLEKHVNDMRLSICTLNIIERTGFEAKSDFCHWGTSTVYYETARSYNPSGERDTFEIHYHADKYEKNYIKFIKDDMAYFNSKNKMTYTLSNEDNTKLDNYFKNPQNEDTLILTINNINIKIVYKDFKNVKYYYVTYTLN